MNSLKYIIDEYGHCMIFSPVVQHVHAAKPLTNTTISLIIGAGFCSIQNNRVECWGESISLKVKSRGRLDAMIIEEQLSL